MLIDTAVLGSFDVEASNVFHMPEGLLGFNEIHSYALIQKQDEGMTLKWFQAVNHTTPCFVVFDPNEIVEGYNPQIEKSDLTALGGCDPKDLTYLVIAVVPEDISKATVNLKSPIVLNQKAKIARQVILANKDYPIRFPLVAQ